MDSLEELKQELELQKTAIINKGGAVTMTYSHPSPSEITAGIGTITVPNYSEATATPADVANGKTFFSNNSSLKTGSLIVPDSTTFEEVYYYTNTDSTKTYYIDIPEGIETLRRSIFYQSPNKMSVNLNEDLVEVEKYAFYDCDDVTINNLPSCTSLTTIGDYAFYGAKGISLSNLPNSISSIGAYAFANIATANTIIKPPTGITSLSEGVFASDERIVMDSYDLSQYNLTYMPDKMMYQLTFDCDFTPPTSVISIGKEAFYRSNFTNFYFGMTIHDIYDGAFGSLTTDPVSMYTTQVMVFPNQIVPIVYPYAFPSQIKDTVVAYVHEQSFTTYQSTLYNYVKFQNILPLSEMP